MLSDKTGQAFEGDTLHAGEIGALRRGSKVGHMRVQVGEYVTFSVQREGLGFSTFAERSGAFIKGEWNGAYEKGVRNEMGKGNHVWLRIEIHVQEFFHLEDTSRWDVDTISGEEETKGVISCGISDIRSSDEVGMCIFLHVCPRLRLN